MTTASEPSNGGYQITEADRIRLCRDRHGMTQDDLAERMGVTRQTISSMENGGPITRRSRISMALVFGVSSKWLESGEYGTDDKSGIPVRKNRRHSANSGYRNRRTRKPYIVPPALMLVA